MVKIVSVIGLKKTGKTTVVEHLVSSLTARGNRVGTIKSMRRRSTTIDVEGKDTHRHQVAGAEFVIAQTAVETSVIYKHLEEKKRPLEELLGLVPKGMDFLITEGLDEHRSDILEIVCMKDPAAWEETREVRKPENVLAFSGILANKQEEFLGLNMFNVLDEESLRRLVEMVLEEAVEFGK